MTADGVAVGGLSGLHQPLIEGYHFVDGTDVEEVRLDADDRVAVIWGLVFVDGHTCVAVTIGASEVTEAMQFFSSPLENGALIQGADGKVTLQVRSDCSWAGMAWVPAG